MPRSSFVRQDDDAGNSSRLQCVLARLGVASRRRCAAIIAGGAVTVNGTIIREPGYHVENPEQDVIRVQGQQVSPPQEAPARRVLMFNKPVGVLCTASTTENRRTIFDLLKGFRERLVSAGRLDLHSQGLLILSNDGALIDRLTHPRYGHTKIYLVDVSGGDFSASTLDVLQSPMTLEDGYQIRPARVEYIKPLHGAMGTRLHRLRFTLREGRNRQIRQMCEQAGLKVVNLTRVAINGLHLPPDLKPGQARDLSARQLALLEEIDGRPLRPWHYTDSTFFRETGRPPWDEPLDFSVRIPATEPKSRAARGATAAKTAKAVSRNERRPRSERTPRSERSPRSAPGRKPRSARTFDKPISRGRKPRGNR